MFQTLMNKTEWDTIYKTIRETSKNMNKEIPCDKYKTITFSEMHMKVTIRKHFSLIILENIVRLPYPVLGKILKTRYFQKL